MKAFLIVFLLFIVFPNLVFSQEKDFRTGSIPQDHNNAILIGNDALKNSLKFKEEMDEIRNKSYIFYKNNLYVYDRFTWPTSVSRIKVIKNKDSIVDFLREKVDRIIIVE